MEKLRSDALEIINQTIHEVMPEVAVKKALASKSFDGRKVYVVAIGKAAWRMAKATSDTLGGLIKKGIVVTKYGHSQGPIEGFEMIEAGHPLPDEHSVIGATKAISMVSELTQDDQLIFLISGGGSALFEKPYGEIRLEDIMDVTSQLLKCGADIVEMNTVRKHLSDVKGGRFANYCQAPIYSVVLSDVVGDRLDSIASGPAYPDHSTSEEALAIIDHYGLKIDDKLREAIKQETPKKLNHVKTEISGSVRALCLSAAKVAETLGYPATILTSSLDGQAREVGRMMASMAREISQQEGISSLKRPCAVIAGGETVVKIMGHGKGGRNQEIALSAALGIEGLENTVIFSIGSDGTDGPTDAAGGLVDGQSAERMRRAGLKPEQELDKNNSYHALSASGDLIKTGATGTNVNDFVVILCR